MKFGEYYRLARISLTERKKETSSTVRGLAIGFIILLPIIVCLFGINHSFKKQLNAAPYLLYYDVLDMTDYHKEMDNYKNAFVSGSKNIDFLKNDAHVTNKIVYEMDKLISDYNNTTKYRIDENEWQPITQLENEHFFSIIDTEKSHSYFPKNLTTMYQGGIFLAGYDQGFSGDGKRQVIVSENFLDTLGIKAKDVYLKKLSISSDSYKDHVNSQQTFHGFICKDYKVVGIIKKEITSIYNDNHFMRANLFFTSVNVYKNGQGVLKPDFSVLPKITVGQDTIGIKGPYEYTYKNFDKKDELNEEYMLLGAYDKLDNTFNYLTFFTTNIYVESRSYTGIYNSYNGAYKYMNSILINKTMFPLKKSNLFERYQFVYELIVFASSVFLIIAAVLIFSAIINVFLTIKHSVKKRTFYLTMLRAIGAKDSTLPKLYMMEAGIMVTRASIFIVTIGTAITAILKLLIDRTLAIKNISYNLSISWLSIVVSVMSIVVFLYLLSFLFSFLCTHKLSKKAIMSILSEN